MQAPSMWHPALPRGAFARLGFIVAMLLEVACWLAGGLNLARAAEPGRCSMVDFDRLQSEIALGHASWLTEAELNFARGLFTAATPKGDFAYPVGDKAFIVPGAGEDGKDIIKFVDGAMGCGSLVLDPGFRAPFSKLKAGIVSHINDSL